MRRLQAICPRRTRVTGGSSRRIRFWSRRILDDGWLFRACIYVVVNPVAAGLCGHPREWPWCSYRSTAYGDPTAYAPGESRLLGMLRCRRPPRPGVVRDRSSTTPVAVVTTRTVTGREGGVGRARRRWMGRAPAGVWLKPDTSSHPPQGEVSDLSQTPTLHTDHGVRLQSDTFHHRRAPPA